MWQGIRGHDAVGKQFERAVATGRLASTFLFLGPEGVGKRAFAGALAKALLCERNREGELAACGGCASCVQVEGKTHPDLHVVSLPEGKSEIPVDLFIGRMEKRMREGLCYEMSLAPFYGKRKIAIIEDADRLNEEGANALLKTLEEPPERSVLILIGTSASKQLPTIRSRSQMIRFEPLPVGEVAEMLLGQGWVESPADAQRLAQASQGRLARAIELADPAVWEFREALLGHLARRRIASWTLAKEVVAFVDGAGKEAPLRRNRARLAMGLAADFYRGLVRQGVGASASGDDEGLARRVEAAVRAGAGDAEIAAARAERCLQAIGHVDRNANQATAIEAWIDDLATGTVNLLDTQ